MAFWQVCPGFARFLRKRSTRVQVSEDIGTRCNRMEVPRVSFAWPTWILLKMIRSLLSKDLPIASELSVSVLSVPPAIPRLFDACRYRLFKILLRYRCSIRRRNIYRHFACQLANFPYHFSFAFALLPIFIRTILRGRSGFLSLLVYPRLWDIVLHPLPFLGFLQSFASLSSLLFDFSLPCPVTVSCKSRQVSLTVLRSSVCRLIWQNVFIQIGTRYFFITESIERDVETLLKHKVLRKLS